MKIIAGAYRGRALTSPPDQEITRPLPARVRESLFGLMRGHVRGATVLDGFAGVGSFGLEAISRGAERVIMIEKDRRIADILRRNIDALGVGDRCELIVGDALSPSVVARAPEDLTFFLLDPPYPLVWGESGWGRVRDQAARLTRKLADDGYAMVRTPWPFTFRSSEPAEPPEFEMPDEDVEVIDLDAPEAEDTLARWDAELEASRGSESVSAPPEPRAAGRANAAAPDLSMPDAVGPETHVYRHTAVHLYMRASAPDAGVD